MRYAIFSDRQSSLEKEDGNVGKSRIMIWTAAV